MILSSLASGRPTPFRGISKRALVVDASSSEPVLSFLCPEIREHGVGCIPVNQFHVRQRNGRVSDSRLLRCRASGEVEVDSASSEEAAGKSKASAKEKQNLAVGSPVVMVEVPPMLKTAEPMPMMRPNRGLINAGDAGRIIDRRPKDVWAVRFAVGAYLIDGKYFKPLFEE